MRLNTIAIYGTGLIGGSFAFGVQRAFPPLRIAGIGKPGALERAKRLEIIDIARAAPPDLWSLATPVGDILKLLDQFKTRQTLITDVGSTKAAICNKAERSAVPFVGGHPMAGLEFSGPEAASANLFENASYFLCRVKSTPDGAL